MYGRVNSYASAYGATLKRVAESQTGTAVHVRNSLDMVLLIMGSAPKQAPMQATLRWVKEQKSKGRLVIATNLFIYEPGKVPRPPGKPPSANQTSHRPHSMKEHAVFFANELCAAAKITSTPLSFLMVPHDFREHRMHGEYKDDGKYRKQLPTRDNPEARQKEKDERKELRKQAKADKAVKRQNKIPKHVKKRAVKSGKKK